MRCRSGDLAIVIAPHEPRNDGKIVNVVRLATGDEARVHRFGQYPVPIWRIDRDVLWGNWLVESNLPFCPDSALRPLRGDLLSDETLDSEPLPLHEVAYG